MPATGGSRRALSLDDFAAGVLAADRAILSRAITLVESSARAHQDLALELVARLLARAGSAVRIGVSGPPGVGKSCLIEALGVRLLEEGRRLAVLAVDPSSPLSRGSILGDKTRMPRLAADPRAFVRPSPAGSSIGGVTHGTREAIILLEAAGHDVVLVETVGVGQSELAVRGMVDFFLLLVQPGSGDELQGLKRGVVEIADAVVVTKADGDNLARAERTRADYAGALRYLAPAEAGWEPPVLTCSALSGAGLGAIWDAVRRHRELGEQSGALARRRHEQAVEGLRAAVAEQLAARFHALPAVAALYPALEKEVGEGRLLPGAAARRLLEAGDQ